MRFAPGAAAARSWWGLGVLVLLGIYAHVDRQMFGLQADAIRHSLALTDAQFGLLQGASVALLTALVGYPVGWVADRADRRLVLALCLLVWSAALAWCAVASGFVELFVASAFIGAAKAGLLPIAYALIPEWFGERQRPVANASFVFLGRLSVGLVIMACGWMIQWMDGLRPYLPQALQSWPTWRLTLLAAACPGIALLPLVLTAPRSGSTRRHAATDAPVHPHATSVLPLLRAHAGTFGGLFAGVGLLAFGGSAVGAFLPVLASRRWNATAAAAGTGMGLAALAGAGLALAVSTWVLRRGSTQARPLTALRLAGLAMVSASLTAGLLVLCPTMTLYFTLYGLSLGSVMTAVMVLPTALQALSPPLLRARLASVYVGSTVIVGALGPLIVGVLSDASHGTPTGLAWAMSGTGALAFAAASLAFAVAHRRMPATLAALRDGPRA